MATRGWSRHLRGHLLLFGERRLPPHDQAAGVRLLTVAAGLEVLRLAAIRVLHPQIPLWVLLPLLLAVALASVPKLARVRLSRLGLRRWNEWSPVEKSYFLQVVLLASSFFLLVLIPAHWRAVGHSLLIRSLWSVLLPYLFFGFYQELVYRGMLQSELVRRWGAPAGILGANLLYTFGPLHWSYFGSPASTAWPMFVSIFLIGLFFGLLYHRSANLWIPACFHAIGNAMIVWRLSAG